MPTFYIHVRKAGNELHSVNAGTFEEALQLFNDGTATLKADETTDVHNVVVENGETGERKNEGDILPDEGKEEPVVRTYGVRLWATFRGEVETTVEATSFDEAVKKATELNHSAFGFSINDSNMEGDETLHVYGPEDDNPGDDNEWGGEGMEVDKRQAGEPFSWDAVHIVKALAKIDLSAGEDSIATLSRLIERARQACTKEAA